MPPLQQGASALAGLRSVPLNFADTAAQEEQYPPSQGGGRAIPFMRQVEGGQAPTMTPFNQPMGSTVNFADMAREEQLSPPPPGQGRAIPPPGRVEAPDPRYVPPPGRFEPPPGTQPLPQPPPKITPFSYPGSTGPLIGNQPSPYPGTVASPSKRQAEPPMSAPFTSAAPQESYNVTQPTGQSLSQGLIRPSQGTNPRQPALRGLMNSQRRY